MLLLSTSFSVVFEKVDLRVDDAKTVARRRSDLEAAFASEKVFIDDESV